MVCSYLIIYNSPGSHPSTVLFSFKKFLLDPFFRIRLLSIAAEEKLEILSSVEGGWSGLETPSLFLAEYKFVNCYWPKFFFSPLILLIFKWSSRFGFFVDADNVEWVLFVKFGRVNKFSFGMYTEASDSFLSHLHSSEGFLSFESPIVTVRFKVCWLSLRFLGEVLFSTMLRTSEVLEELGFLRTSVFDRSYLDSGAPIASTDFWSLVTSLLISRMTPDYFVTSFLEDSIIEHTSLFI